MMNLHHVPVLLNESLEYLITDNGGIYFDGTLGFGGHSGAILDRLNENGILISTDIDEDALRYSKERFADNNRIRIYNFNFSRIDIISKIESIQQFDGVFADLGVSSFQLDTPESGFTYRNEAKLDLRMDKDNPLTAAEILNTYEEEEIANIIFQFGEEKNSRRIARLIIEKRKTISIDSTIQLSSMIAGITPQKYLTKTLSRVFQALRIYINDELNVLKSFIEKSVELLKPGGRIVILSYHSLEDRIIKDLFKYESLNCVCPKNFPVCTCGKVQRLKILTKKPVVPGEVEVKNNYRARSAKLRAAERI